MANDNQAIEKRLAELESRLALLTNREKSSSDYLANVGESLESLFSTAQRVSDKLLSLDRESGDVILAANTHYHLMVALLRNIPASLLPIVAKDALLSLRVCREEEGFAGRLHTSITEMIEEASPGYLETGETT